MDTPAREAMKPFLNVKFFTVSVHLLIPNTCFTYIQIVLEMILSQQLSSDLLNVASGTFYALICAYQVKCWLYFSLQMIINWILFISRPNTKC